MPSFPSLCPSVCLSNCLPSYPVLGADLHRKHSWGRDRCQGLHHHLWRPGGHRGTVPRQVREPHQQVRERNGRRACGLDPLPFSSPGAAIWGPALLGPGGCLGTLCFPLQRAGPLSADAHALGPAYGVRVGLEKARGLFEPWVCWL